MSQSTIAATDKVAQNVPSELVPYHKLKIAPENVRRSGRSKEKMESMAASIAAVGVLVPVLARPADDDGVINVVAGGYRLGSVGINIEKGLCDDTYEVPCIIRDWRSAREISLMENVLRNEMDDVERFRGYVDLIEKDGMTTGEVACRFGTNERDVIKILKLGRLDEKVLDAYQNGKFEKSTLYAFTLSDDKERQTAALKRIPPFPGDHSGLVRQCLTDKSLHSRNPLAIFVGRKAYEEAGGAVTTDLFNEDDDVYFDDIALVERLATERVERRAKKIASKWHWTSGRIEKPYDLPSYRRVYAEPINVPGELTAALEALDKEVAALEDTPDDKIGQGHYQSLLSKRVERRELVKKIDDYAAFSEEQRAIAGCIVTIDLNGKYKYIEGLVKPEDAAGLKTAGNSSPGREAPKEKTPYEKEMDEAGVIQKTHREDLVSDRTEIVQAHLANDFNVAFDLLLLELCEALMSPVGENNPLNISCNETYIGDRFGNDRDMPATRKLKGIEQRLSRSWLNQPPEDRFEALSSLSRREKQKLFSWCVAMTLKKQLAISDNPEPAIETAVDRLGIDFARFWRPDEEYWKRTRKSSALDIGEEILGQTWRQSHKSDKKEPLAKSMARSFSGDPKLTSTLDSEIRQAAAIWLPPGFRVAQEEPSVDEGGDAASADPNPSTEAGINEQVPPPVLRELEDDKAAPMAAE